MAGAPPVLLSSRTYSPEAPKASRRASSDGRVPGGHRAGALSVQPMLIFDPAAA